MNTDKTKPSRRKQYWRVDYTWPPGVFTHLGHTVVTAPSQLEAEAKFSRLHKHLTVTPRTP